MPAKDSFIKVVNVVHRALFDITKGAGFLGRVGPMAAVKLETVGRKSGQTRTTMLTTPVQRGDDVVLVASWGGDDRHPMWYLNLRDNPEVTLTMGGKRWKAVARTATADEKSELWPQIVEKYKGYAGYQEKTDRDIPVVICSPAA